VLRTALDDSPIDGVAESDAGHPERWSVEEEAEAVYCKGMLVDESRRDENQTRGFKSSTFLATLYRATKGMAEQKGPEGMGVSFDRRSRFSQKTSASTADADYDCRSWAEAYRRREQTPG